MAPENKFCGTSHVVADMTLQKPAESQLSEVNKGHMNGKLRVRMDNTKQCSTNVGGDE